MDTARIKAVARLNRALHTVRADLDSCIEQYRLRMAARISDAIRVLDGGVPGEEMAAQPTLAALKRAAVIVNRVEFKPRKGRGKDLKHLDDVVSELLKQLLPEKPSLEDTL